jgi:hypothetical protein
MGIGNLLLKMIPLACQNKKDHAALVEAVRSERQEALYEEAWP